MANLNLILFGLLIVGAGGTVGLLSFLLLRQELLVHRRPRIIIAFVLSITVLCVLFNSGIPGLVVCMTAAICFFAAGTLVRAILFGTDWLTPVSRLPRGRFVAGWRLNTLAVVKFLAFLAVIIAMLLAAKGSYQVHLKEQEPGPSYLDLIENIESDID